MMEFKDVLVNLTVQELILLGSSAKTNVIATGYRCDGVSL